MSQAKSAASIRCIAYFYSMKTLVVTLFLFLIYTSYSCAHNPYAATNKIYKQQAKTFAKTIRQLPTNDSIDSISPSPYFVGTTNFNLRKPNFVIIHHTAQDSTAQTLKTFTLPRTQVSAHYVIGKDGSVYHLLNDYMRAWHGGIARWGSVTDINSISVGIELDNNGFEPFTEPQIQSLLHVLTTLKKQYNIPAANFIGHGDIAPTRKNDPNPFFPWQTLAQRGFGYWYDDTTNVAVPESFNGVQALRIIGYDVKDSLAAIQAFHRHWEGDSLRVLSDADKKVLYMVEKKFM